METTAKPAKLPLSFQAIATMPLPTLLTAVVLIVHFACALAWGRPPVKSQKGHIAAPPSAAQRGDGTIAGFLPSASGMEANLASTLCSSLWTHSTYESCFPSNPQPSRPGKQLTQSGKLKEYSQRKPQGKNQLTKSGKLGVHFADHDAEPGPDGAPRPSDFLQPPLRSCGKMRVFNQGLDLCLQGPGKRMDIMKGNLAGQLTIPLPQYKCQYCAKVCKSRGGLTHHANNCKSKPRITLQHEPLPTPTPTVSPSPSDNAGLNKEFLLNEEPALDEVPLTLAECSRLVSAYIEQPEWQDFLDTGRHATTQTRAVKTGWNGLKLDTVSTAHQETPFPALTTAALKTLMQLSPTIGRLYQQLQTGKDPLKDRDNLKAFLNKASQNDNELFAGGNHSLVIKWRNGPGYVFKIARSERDHTRLNRERNLYLWLRDPDNFLLNLTTTPMNAAFSVSGKPVLALRQADGTARDRLRLMREHSLNERLDFALSVIMHFCQMYRRFLEKDVLLADRHDDNIGFNEIPLQGRKSMGLDDALIQVPVMLDLDPYWFGDQESREIQLHLPTWVPVVAGLLEEVFTPVTSDSQISKSRVEVIDKLRQLASPVFPASSSSTAPETVAGDIETALQSCINHWFRNINPGYSELLAEARSHIEPLLTGQIRWDSTPRTVAKWNKRLQENIDNVLQWLNSWKNETEFSLLKDFTDEGIIRVPSRQGPASSRDQQILTLLSMIHGKLGCQKCSRTFTSNIDFRKHWQLHQQNKLQHCEICGGDFTHTTVHKRVHTEEKPYKCEHCGKCFSLASTLKRHLRIHSGDKPYKCEHCGKCFSQSNILQNHLRIHSGDKPYKCEHCGKCFSETGTLKTHLRTHSGDKPYKCKHCNSAFATTSNLKSHLRTHTGDKPYKCEHCGKTFSKSNILQTHLRTHSGDKAYQCEHCSQCFSQKSNLLRHLRTHSGGKPYKCEHCGKCFSQSNDLQRHLRIHSGDKPYKCEHCGKCFSLGYNLKGHLRVHTGDKPYKCEYCGKCFTYRRTLKDHLHTHSGDKPYKCEHCGKTFSKGSYLKSHLRIHSGDKPYKCEHCGKYFSQGSNLKRHLRSHSGDKPYKCKRCGKSYSSASNKNKHQNKCRIEQP